MTTIHTTQKAWNRLGKNRKSVIADDESTSDCWCAHIFYSGHTQFLMITNERTLLTVVLPAKDLQRISEVLPQSIDILLQTYGVEKPARDKYIQQLSALQYSRNTKRQILGSMNDFIRMAKYILEDEPGLSLLAVSLQLCNIPCSPIKMKSPQKATMDLILQGSVL